jgi:hypothetical protein
MRETKSLSKGTVMLRRLQDDLLVLKEAKVRSG